MNSLISIRSDFPSIQQKVNGNSIIYLDGPAGTQVPKQVLEAMNYYYTHYNSNTHGHFMASQETDRILEEVRQKVATFLNAPGPECISFGQNMTTLNYSLSKGLGRIFNPGDEIVITQLDHEANRGPWLALEELGIVTREIKLLANGTLDYDSADLVINEKTKLVCVGHASNIFGTMNDIARIKQKTEEVGAYLLIDAVHAAPHCSIDVQELDCDFLLCSAYKFYGPHVGLLYCRPGLLDNVPTDRLRTQESVAPYKIETGTLNHAAIAGVGAAIEFISSCGEGENLRSQLVAALEEIHQHEIKLAKALWRGLDSIPGVHLLGPSIDVPERAPTLAFTIEGLTPAEICQHLGKAGIYAWDGHFYAIRAVVVLDIMKIGGVTRMGVVVYNTMEEIDRTINEVRTLAEQTYRLRQKGSTVKS